MHPDAQQLDLRRFFTLTPALRTLVLTDLIAWPLNLSLKDLPLKTLVLKRIGLPSFPLLPSTLEHLTLEASPQGNLTALHFDAMSSSLSNLTHLTMSGFAGFTRDFFSDFLDFYLPDPQLGGTQQLKPMGGTPLTHLSISGTLDSDTRGLFRNPDNILATSPRLLTPALQSLTLHNLGVNDDEVEALLTYPTGLQSIDLSGSKVTGASIKMLTDGLKGLKTIRADNCSAIVGRDAIAYAQARGVNVKCAMGDGRDGKGGRRVRE
jgi:F-box/TPR repeat protein Pof3